MGLFGFGKKKVEEEKPVCCCAEETTQVEEACCCGEAQTTSEASCCCGETQTTDEASCCGNDQVTSVKVLGAGCKSCHDQFEYAKKAVAELGLDVEVEYVTDLEKVMAYGVMSMPAIVVNEKVVAVGKVVKTAGVKKLLG